MSDYDLLVLGAGPGGYVAAIRAAQLGLKTAIVERENLGGVCLNWGCIPSKALLRNAEVLELCKRAEEFGISFENLRHDFGKAIDRSRQIVRRLTGGVGFLLKKNGVAHITGEGVFRDKNTILIDGGKPVSADNIIIATGARPRELPNLPINNSTIITSRDAMELREVPKRIVIVGGGAIGVEFADIYHSYGSEVTIVEFLPRLIPLEDEEISRQLEKAFSNRGISFRTDSEVRNVMLEGGGVSVEVANEEGQTNIECDKVLVAVGIQGNTEGFGFEEVGIELERGYVQIDDEMQTNVPGIYAIGDVTGKLPLAHVATAQGVTAVESIAGLNPSALNYELMPRAIYCRPQVASFGLTEEQAKARGYSVKTGMFPFMASGKALAMGDAEGMVKLVVDEEGGEVLGAHMIGPEVTELLGEVGLSRLLEGTTTELGWLVHPHPSISEAIKEAALAVDGRAIHV